MSRLLLALGERADFTPDARFAPGALSPIRNEPQSQPSPEPESEADAIDREQMAFDRGFAEGLERARAEFETALAERMHRLDALEDAFVRLGENDSAALREQLRQTVLALCESAVLPLALDTDALARRIERAAGMLMRAQDEKRIRINPEDFELVRGLVREDLRLEPDPAIERGALRIDTEDGGVEDGPSCWSKMLREALGEC